MTSVYQIIESRGQSDDYHEQVYATYLNLDRALKDLQTLQELEDIRIEQGKQEPCNYFIDSIDVIE